MENFVAKKKLEGMTPQERENLFVDLTQDSPLILFGKVVKRWTISGVKDGREWTMRQAMIAGANGIAIKMVLGEKETQCPARGEIAMIPCIVGNNGQLREARDLGLEF